MMDQAPIKKPEFSIPSFRLSARKGITRIRRFFAFNGLIIERFPEI
jgi:hypothetical protein